MKKKIITLCIILFVIGVCLFGVLYFQVTTIQVEGNHIYSEQEIEEYIFQKIPGRSALCLYIKNRFTKRHAIPFVQEVDISWKGRDTIHVQVYEKSLVACFHYMGEYVYFDKDGIVLESSKKKLKGKPIIEGIPFSGFAMNKKMDMQDDKILKKILDLSQLVEHYKLSVDKLMLEEGKNVTIVCEKIEVKLGNRESYDDQIAAVSTVVEQAVDKNLSGRIDLVNYRQGDKIILTQK